MFEELDIEVPDAVIDRAHRIGAKKIVKGRSSQQMIMRFTTWRDMSEVYRRKRSKNVKIHLDLTKRRLDLLILANSIMKAHPEKKGTHLQILIVGYGSRSAKSIDSLILKTSSNSYLNEDNESTEDPDGLDNPEFA